MCIEFDQAIIYVFETMTLYVDIHVHLNVILQKKAPWSMWKLNNTQALLNYINNDSIN